MGKGAWTVLGFGVVMLVLTMGCRPVPYAVATIVSFKARDADGTQCYQRCQEGWHACAAECHGPSTSVVIGVGPIAVGSHRSPASCRHHCRGYRTDCLRGCPGVQEQAVDVRYCPDGPGRCEEPDPHSPKLALPLYCHGPDGQLRPCR
jgi:hypothetical protein